jgi:hypothetical protein
MDRDKRVTTFERVVSVLSDREWHTREELAELTPYPDWWLDELQHERIEIVKDGDRVKLSTTV